MEISIEGYNLLKVIGSGSFSVVYLAEDQVTI